MKYEVDLPAGAWSAKMEVRRCELIDKGIAGMATAAEQAELNELDQRANEHFDRVAPIPIEGAHLLHQKLLQNRAYGQ